MSAAENAVLTPSVVHDPCLFQTPSASSSLQASAGGIFKNGRFAWILNRSGHLYVFNSITGECTAQLRLGPRGSHVRVSCSCELSSVVATKPLLVLAASDDTVKGKTTIFVVDPAASKLVKSVIIPWAVSSLCGIAEGCLQMAGLFSFSFLESFSGILAVGCDGGHVLLVDLVLYEKELIVHPKNLVFESLQSGLASSTVAEARRTGRHACVDVLASYHHKKLFQYRPRGSDTTKEFPVDSLAITSLHFVPQILTLFIGYSFGGFQLFSLSKMSVVHSSPCPKAPLPVTHFTYQEPENDPKHNVYLWVGRGNLPSVSLNVDTKLTLYQILFARRVGNGRETVYQDFQSCGPAFLYPLTPTPTRPNISRSRTSALISCSTVEMTPRLGRGLDESHDETAHGPDLTVAVFLWRCGDSAHQDYIVGVFDLNQYYHSQVPKMLHWQSSGKRSGALGCSYFTFYSLRPVTGDRAILDAAVTNWSPFSSLPPVPEVHLWPTSLSFDVTVISSDGFLKCTCLGLQRMALEELRMGGVAVFSQPQNVFSICERAELLGPAWELDHSSIEVQQKALLSVALEHHVTSVLSACAHTWTQGGSPVSLSVLVDWIRQKMEDYMNEKDRLCHQLFCGLTDSVDKSLSSILNHLRLMFHRLSRLLTSLLTPLTSSQDSQLHNDDPLITELSGIYVTATTAHTVAQVVIWCVKSGLLPAASASGSSGRYFVYPALALKRLYDRLRKESLCKLSVDYLCEDLQSDYHYPPNSLEDILGVYTTSNSHTPHCVMMYFLCDISNLDEPSFNQDMLVDSYSQHFNLPKQLTALAQGLWALDHSKYDVARRKLIGEQFGASLWFPWQHSAALSLFLQSPDPRLALQYSDAYRNFLGGADDFKIMLRALVQRQCVSDALRLMRPYEDSEEVEELFTYFLDLCFQHKCLSKLVDIPLNEFEDAFFCHYLEESPSLKAQELLVMHCLAHHRYSDAMDIQEKIRPLAMADPDSSVRERSDFRDCLLEGFSRSVPTVLREVRRSELKSTHKHHLTTKVTHPTLSSVLAKNAATKMRSEVDEIYRTMKDIVNARDVPAEPLTPFKQREQEVPHTPFFSPPPSVRKAMSSRRKGSVVRATPVQPLTSSNVSVPDHSISGSASGLSYLSSYMQNFKQRMFQLSQTAGTIDVSLIRTPLTKPVESSVVHVSSPLPPPPSILKVKQPPPLSDEGESGEGGGVGEGEGKSTPATTTRKIRFAVEGSPIVSPTSSISAQSVTGGGRASLALATPLPSSDDSDLYYSFSDSPNITSSPHHSTHPPQDTPSQSPLPEAKAQLFVGADEDYEDEVPDGAVGVAQTDDQSDLPQKSHDQDAVMTTEREASPVLKEATPKIRFQAHSLLTRERLGHRPNSTPQQTETDLQSKTTPTNISIGGSGGKRGPFAPARPSPLSYSITSKSVTSTPSIKSLKISLSSTMVQLPQQPSQSTDKETTGSEGYSFSPGKIISTPPVQEIETSGPSFMFSPPLTRSAARKKAAAVVATEEGGNEAPPNPPNNEQGTQRAAQSKKPMRSRGSRAMPAQLEPVQLVSPPSRQATPTTTTRQGRHRSRQQPTRAVQTGNIRRSTRLLQDRK